MYLYKNIRKNRYEASFANTLHDARQLLMYFQKPDALSVALSNQINTYSLVLTKNRALILKSKIGDTTMKALMSSLAVSALWFLGTDAALACCVCITC